MLICLRLETHEIRRALSLALENAGKSMEANMEMMAMTTKSSMSVKPRELVETQREENRDMVFFGVTKISWGSKCLL